jgi:hypothetical protein
VAPCRIEHLVSEWKQRKAEQGDAYTSAMIVKMVKMMDEMYRFAQDTLFIMQETQASLVKGVISALLFEYESSCTLYFGRRSMWK